MQTNRKTRQRIEILSTIGIAVLLLTSGIVVADHHEGDGDPAPVVYKALTDFPDIAAGDVPYYKDNNRSALAIDAANVSYREKFARAVRLFDGTSALYDVTLTTVQEEDGESTYRLLVNSEVVAEFQNPYIGVGSPENNGTLEHIWEGIVILAGDEIAIESNTHTNGDIPEGDGTAWSRGRWQQIELTYAGEVPPAAPLASYSFNDGTAADGSGNGFDGMLLGIAPDPNDPNDPNVMAEIVNDPSRGSVMKINGWGMQIDGPFDVRSSVTLAFWTQIDLPRAGRFFSGGPWQFRTDNQSSDAHDWVELRYPEGSFLNKADTRLGDPNSLGQLDGQWHHYAIVLNDAGDPNLFFDGIEAPLRDADKLRVHDFNGIDTIFFGTQNADGANALQGYMDDIALYNVALDADAVVDLMIATSPILAVETTDSLVATGSDGDLLTLDDVDVNDLILATVVADYEKFPDHPATDAENFSLATYASLDDANEIIILFPEAVEVINIVERGANDLGFFQALDADGVPFGALTPFAKSDWLKTEYDINGQAGGAIRILADRPIYGLRVTPDGTLGLDPASVSGIAVGAEPVEE